MKNTAGQGLSGKNHDDNDQTRLLQKLVIYIKLANYDSIRSRLMVTLNSDDKKRVFEATDGKRSVRDIQSATGVDKSTISNWWTEWQKEGIVEESKEAQGRRRKGLSLTDFGIEVPTGKNQHTKKRVTKSQKSKVEKHSVEGKSND